MTSPSHEQYTQRVRDFIAAQPPGIHQRIEALAPAILILATLDLSAARPILRACYADKHRGQPPRDPLAMFRALLLSLLIGEHALTHFVDQARRRPELAVLSGFEPGDFPGVGTFYDFFARLHDGPSSAYSPSAERPSQRERRRARCPRPRIAATQRKAEREQAQAAAISKTRALLNDLLARQDHPLPNDLGERLNQLLLHVAVRPSAARGLLGDPTAIHAVGDGSPLRTGARGRGHKVCDCASRRCDCPRRYSDPDAAWGWDSYRKCFFFGHHFWELGCSSEGVDLPLALDLAPGNASDHLQGLACLDATRKRFAAEGLEIATVIEDAGHDSEPLHEYLRAMGLRAVIPLAGKAPARLPGRADVELSKRGVPLCPAGEEMIKNGSAGKGCQVWCCPLKKGRIRRCPNAPVEDPEWTCQPETKYGPTKAIRSAQTPRLLPEIARNSVSYEALYRQRSGSERSNAVKKEVFNLEAGKHRRQSLWFIKLALCAILQHVRAWVRGLDAQTHFAKMLC